MLRFNSTHNKVCSNFSALVVTENNDVKQYLWHEFKLNNNPKYYKYFEEWFNNLTETQLLFYNAYSKGDKTICCLR